MHFLNLIPVGKRTILEPIVLLYINIGTNPYGNITVLFVFSELREICRMK